MIARSGSGWQTVLADLSLILFMITAAAVSEGPAKPAPPIATPPLVLPALGEPVAVWRAAPDAPDLRAWLAQNASDPRLRVTIIAPGPAAAEALALSKSAGRPARVLLEPGVSGAPVVTLTYDQAAHDDQASLARGLREPAAKETLP